MEKKRTKKEVNPEKNVAAVKEAKALPEKEISEEVIQGETVLKYDETLVVVFCDGDDEDMLKYAVRSAQKNIIGMEANVLVVGNRKPDFVKPEDFIEADIKSWADPADQWKVARLLHENKDVMDDFILMEPGMIVCHPVMIANIAVLKARPETSLSVKMLRKLDFPNPQNYNTQTPVLISKGMIDFVNQFEDVKSCELVTALLSVYFIGEVQPHFIETKAGAWKNGPWLLPVVSPDPLVSVLEHYFSVKNFAFFSENSRTKKVKEFLAKRFPEKSCIEID